MDFLKDLNWVDILIVLLAVRIVYSSIQTGFVTEFMKLFALVMSLFMALHYYTTLGAVMGHAMGLPVRWGELLAFTVIWVLIVIAFRFIRDGIFMVFSVETLSAVDRWGAALISVARFYLTASMVLFVFLVSDSPYMERVTRGSFAQKYVLNVAPDLYRNMTNGFVGKLFPAQKVNPGVSEELFESGR